MLMKIVRYNIISMVVSLSFFLQCTNKESPTMFESNISFNRLEENIKALSKSYDFIIIHKAYVEAESRSNYKVLAKKNENWCKLLFSLSNNNEIELISEACLDDIEAKLILIQLGNYNLFNLEPMSSLLDIHKKLCGPPQDPSHFLIFDLYLISGKEVRKETYANPSGRFEHCPAIKNWGNISNINKLFMEEWVENKFSEDEKNMDD
jgi:hypothetical protein